MSDFIADAAETQFVAVADVTYAYRRLGSRTDIPLLLASRFRGTTDHWDPALLDRLATERHVVIFDSAGVGLSTGEVPESIAAIGRWSRNEEAAWDHLSQLCMPVLVANGAHDVIIPAYQTYAMTQRLPRANAVIYSDAGHGFLFQHPADFAAEVLQFLVALPPLSAYSTGAPRTGGRAPTGPDPDI